LGRVVECAHAVAASPGRPRIASHCSTPDLAWRACRAVARAFADQRIPLTSVTAFVQELGDVQPLSRRIRPSR
jgi:hypothetical protein